MPTPEAEITAPSKVRELLTPLFDSAALYCIYEIRASGERYNVYTVFVRALKRKTTSIDREVERVDVPARNGHRRYTLLRTLVDAEQADRFIVDATTNYRATIPGSDVEVRFVPTIPDHAFLSHRSADRLRSPLNGRAAWSARHWAREKWIGKLRFEEGSISRTLAQLPTIDDIRFRLLNVYDRPDVIGDLEDLYPIGLSMHSHGGKDGFSIELEGDERWLAHFGDLSVHGVLGQPLRPSASVYHRFSKGGRTVRWTGIDVGECDLTLSGNGILLAREHTTTVRAVQGTLHISNRTLRVDLAEENAAIDIAIAQDSAASRFRTGSVDTLTSIVVPSAFLAERWNEQQRRTSEFVLGPTEGASIVVTLERLVALVRSAVAPPFVRIIDAYAIDPKALRRIAVVAAASRAPALEILTLQRKLPQLPSFNFELEAKRIEKAVGGITIRLFQPKFDIHDRFLWVGDRIWHFGHSFNSFGSQSLSVVTELRDLRVLESLREILGSQFK